MASVETANVGKFFIIEIGAVTGTTLAGRVRCRKATRGTVYLTKLVGVIAVAGRVDVPCRNPREQEKIALDFLAFDERRCWE
jgi:hypothetical protein